MMIIQTGSVGINRWDFIKYVKIEHSICVNSTKTAWRCPLTEFEEITLKKIIKNKMVEDFYVNLNVLLGSSGIRNKELSSKIGWDAAGYNQKLNRRSDLKLSTLIYSQVKVGIRPSIYALSTVIFVLVLIVLLIANILPRIRERRERRK